MKRWTTVVASVLLVGAGTPPTERVISGDGVVTLSVDGKPVRVRIDPAAAGMPLLTQAVAERLRLKESRRMGIGFVYSIGPVRVVSKTRVARVDVGGGPAKQRVGWAE